MELKYVGLKPVISEHGISFKDGKEDKYVYLSFAIDILIALEDDIKIIDVKAENPILNIFFDESKNSMKKIFDISLDKLDEYQDKYNEFLHYNI